MQSGLNIGIASWIDSVAGKEGRPAFPAVAIPFELHHLSQIEAPADIARAAELSLLANRMGDSDWRYDTGGVVEYLWNKHREIIGEMVTAISTLTAVERRALDNAEAVLFKPDGMIISDRYALFIETRQIYEDLVLADAAAADIQAAYESWVTVGHKVEVEEALAVKMTLSRGTSRLVASNDVTRIEFALETLGSNVPFVPTLFTPMSAASTKYWTEAEVDLQALEDAIPPEVPRIEWKRFRANKSGKIRIRYIVVDLIRPWFSPELYDADDWRLEEGDSGMVADGIGVAGRIPAFFSSLYMVQVLDIRYDSVKQGSLPVKPSKIRPGNISMRPSVVRSSTLNLRPALLQDEKGRIKGVVPSRNSVLEMNSVVGKPISPASAVLKTNARSTRLGHAPPLKISVAGRVSKIQKLTALTAISKLNFAQSLLAAANINSETLVERPTWLVGFGRSNLPACPNPNQNYQWP